MAKTIPTEIEIVNGIKLKVIEKELQHKRLGYWDPNKQTIYINTDQSEYGKWETLFHEVLHAIDDEFILSGQKKIAFTEKSIEFAAASIFGFLVINKLTHLVEPNPDFELFVEKVNRDIVPDEL